MSKITKGIRRLHPSNKWQWYIQFIGQEGKESGVLGVAGTLDEAATAMAEYLEEEMMPDPAYVLTPLERIVLTNYDAYARMRAMVESKRIGWCVRYIQKGFARERCSAVMTHGEAVQYVMQLMEMPGISGCSIVPADFSEALDATA